jgi:DNA invertase Pin-like site-specific DNA recombinase
MTAIGYARISKSDGSQSIDFQIDALKKVGVKLDHIYQDCTSGKNTERPGLDAALKALRKGDVFVTWKLDRLGRDFRHLVNTIQNLSDREIGFRVLTGNGAEINTTTASGKLVFGIFASLAEFERELIRERTLAGLSSARKRGRNGGRRFSLSKAKLRLAMSSMGKKDTCVGDLCRELGVSRPTIYRYVGPDGKLRQHGKKLLDIDNKSISHIKLFKSRIVLSPGRGPVVNGMRGLKSVESGRGPKGIGRTEVR